MPVANMRFPDQLLARLQFQHAHVQRRADDDRSPERRCRQRVRHFDDGRVVRILPIPADQQRVTPVAFKAMSRFGLEVVRNLASKFAWGGRIAERGTAGVVSGSGCGASRIAVTGPPPPKILVGCRESALSAPPDRASR